MTRRDRLISLALDAALVLGLSILYLSSFDLMSSVNGPYEVFAQDSVYILESLADGESYPWNPQSHLLYHYLIQRGFEIWKIFFAPGIDGAYPYLKLFTAGCGLLFLAAMAWLFRELELPASFRAVLLVLTGISVMAWFHFAAFETHCLALPAVALYLVAIVRLRDRTTRGLGDRLLLIGALLICGWTRIELFRIAAVSVVLLALPALARHRRVLLVDLACVVVLGFLGNALLAHAVLDEPLSEAATAPYTRDDRPELEERLGRIEHLVPAHLLSVGRAVTLYSVLMPIARPAPGRTFLSPPTYELKLKYSGLGTFPSTTLFLEPARNLFRTAVSLFALLAVGSVLGAALFFAARHFARDLLPTVVLCQAAAGWLFYTWFNPLEPFLWTASFLPLWIAIAADYARGRGRVHLAALVLAAVAAAIHNVLAFYLPFR